MLSADMSTLLLVRVFYASPYVRPCNMHTVEFSDQSVINHTLVVSRHFVATSHVAGIVLHHLLAFRLFAAAGAPFICIRARSASLLFLRISSRACPESSQYLYSVYQVPPFDQGVLG